MALLHERLDISRVLQFPAHIFFRVIHVVDTCAALALIPLSV